MSDFTFPFDSCEKPQQTIEIGGGGDKNSPTLVGGC